MNWQKNILFILSFSIVISCDNDTDEILSDTQIPQSNTISLVEALDKELYPLGVNPLSWSDNDLSFLDPLANKSIIGLGEATHGTSEFFKSKFSMFKYLVENHDFKVFAFEADFGESLLINDAIQRGATSEIENLMNTNMHFWTWRTEEVKDLLEWMSEYNINQADEDKIHYMGFDCQFNTFHPDMVKEYLVSVSAPFISDAIQILDEAEAASQANFDSYTPESFENYLEQLDALQDSIVTHAPDFIGSSSAKEYMLNLRLARVIRQVSEVVYANSIEDTLINYRDQYMAENAAWMKEYFNGSKMVLWAHNSHIGNDPTLFGGGGSMGRHLRQEFGSDYTTIAFLFAQGSFTAYSQIGQLESQNINAIPKQNSINYLMSRGKESVFAIEIGKLEQYDSWLESISNELEYFDIGAVYNGDPGFYYKKFNPIYFEYIIYFDSTTASVLL